MTTRRGRFARQRISLLTLLLAVTAPTLSEEAKFDPIPWVEDLHQVRGAMSEKYANFEWAVFEREVNLSDLFDEMEVRLRAADGDQDAKAIIDRGLRSIGDGHLRVRWPVRAASLPASPPDTHLDICGSLGYDATMRGRALGPFIPGYRPLPDTVAPEFPAGLLTSGATQIGVIRIGLFSPQGYPELCASMRAQLAITDSCNQQCADRLESAEYAVMSRDLALRIKELQKLGSTVLLIDITGNGGGSEWAEAAARIVSPLRLRSERRYGVRGSHWADYWGTLSQELRKAEQASASAVDAEQINAWIPQVEKAKAEANTPCSAGSFWTGQHPRCEWLAPAFYATGVLGEADAAVLHKKPWGPLVFSPAQYEFEESVWHQPLLVLVDGGTGSASEEFAAVLRDNNAAVVIGAPTAGAGCGHTEGGTPTTLTHSLGILELPDCMRARRDGSNEVRGVDPDILIGFRTTDGMHRRGQRVTPALSQAITAAVQLYGRTHCKGGRFATEDIHWEHGVVTSCTATKAVQRSSQNREGGPRRQSRAAALDRMSLGCGVPTPQPCG